VLARGLVPDREARVVRATPFPKFFNHGEMAAPIPDEPFVADEKMDGSLAILFHDGDRWRVATKGSFDSPQARLAELWLAAHPLHLLTPGTTYLFELIATDNRIVVKYDFEGLVLLGALDEG
jgi:RNA ligase